MVSHKLYVPVIQVKDKGTVYPVGQILVNVTNSYEVKKPEPEMLELAKFAKHHVPEEHEKVGPFIPQTRTRFLPIICCLYCSQVLQNIGGLDFERP